MELVRRLNCDITTSEQECTDLEAHPWNPCIMMRRLSIHAAPSSKLQPGNRRMIWQGDQMRTIRLLLLAFLILAIPAAAFAQFAVSVTIAPPALPVYERSDERRVGPTGR